MSKKMYAFLLLLYPREFRESYGAEAMQLFRDRVRDERGLFAKLRLWFDMAVDLVGSAPREYYYLQPGLAGGALQCSDSVPCFDVLEGGSPRLDALLLGAILSIATLTAFPALINYAGEHDRAHAPASAIAQPTPLHREAKVVAQDRDVRSIETGRSEPPLQAPDGQLALGALGQATASDANLDLAERQRVINAVVANLNEHYFNHDVAHKTAEALKTHDENGDDNVSMSGPDFAGLLTTQMRDASHDMHLVVEYSRDKLPEHPPEPTPEDLARYRKAMLQENCMLRKVAVQPHNVGYLKLDFFPDTSVCESTARTAMGSLNNVDAIIFDLRDNTGGFPDMVSLIASYLFDHPEYMYGPRGAPTEQSWTRSPVPGNHLADKPVYVLISSSTWSGAEQFSYALKMLKRATLVGETTRGGAHAGIFYRIDDHFGMGIPEERAINPFGKADWEGAGVEPDVKVKATDALDIAMKLAASKLPKK